MAAPKDTQKTQPRGVDPKTGKPYEPIDIPVPKKADWERNLGKVTKPKRDK